MDFGEGSYLDPSARNTRFGNMSGIVHSPATAKDGRSRVRKTGEIMKSMKLLDDAIANDSIMSGIAMTPKNFDFDSTVNTNKTSRFNISRFRKSTQRSEDSMFMEPSELGMTAMLEETAFLFDPETPHRFKSKEQDAVSVESASMSLFTDFKTFLTRYGSSVDLFQLVDSYMEVCEDNESLVRSLAVKLRKGPGFEMADGMHKLMKQEKQTWRLISALYKDRQASATYDDGMNIDDLANNISERKAVEKLFEVNSDVRQAQIVIDWLEQNAADEIEGEADRLRNYASAVSWENTLHRLNRNKEQGIEDPNLIYEMDPDAPTRLKREIDDLDREDEKQLLKIIFSFIRAGKIEEAEDLCVTHGQPWRAATLEGWRLHNDPNMNDDASEDMGLVPIEGNPHRDLWKLACWTLSSDETYNAHERAIYGALCGNMEAMLSVSSSWDDHLWAQYKTMVDMATERHIQQTANIMKPWQCVVKQIPLPDGYWKQNIDLGDCELVFNKIENSNDQIVREESDNPYHFIQRCIILNDMEAMMDKCMEWLDDASMQLLRFLVHIILFLRTLGVHLQTEHCDKTIEAYVRKLIADGRTNHLVATYTAALPSELQIINYSAFLEAITDSNLQKEYLELAMEAGLEIPAITKRVVESIRSIGGVDQSVTPDSSIELPVTIDDQRKIDSIEWLVFDPSQRCEALKQCNAVMRQFLASRKHEAAHDVFVKIPSDSIEILYNEWHAQADKDVPLPADADNAIREHLCMKAYLGAHTSFKEWFKHLHTSKPQEYQPTIHQTSTFGSVSIPELVAEEHRQKVSADKISAWDDKLRSLCDLVCDKIYNVLLFPQGWLVDMRDDGDSEEGEWRNHQMGLLRRVCIPYLSNLLLTVLVDTGGRYKECGQLANVLASEEYKLYELFTKQEGKEIMKRIQEALIKTL
ncbi:nuclear pore complex protein Nup107-like [Ciona intestinalis]